MTLIMILLAVCGGATLSIQAAINGQLGSSVGVFKSAFLTFSVGALVTALLIFFFEPKHAVTLLDVPKWQLLGAMFGVPYIVIMVLAVQRIGTAVATVAVIFGQLTMSMLIDNFGWLGNPASLFAEPSGRGYLPGDCAVFHLLEQQNLQRPRLDSCLPGKEQRHRGDGDAKFLHLGFIKQMGLILQVHPVVKLQ